jgi:hypothetical protein
MTRDQVLKTLLAIRYSPRAGRPVGISWIARQAGYTHVAIFHAISLGRISPAMATRLAPILVKVQQGNIAPTLGRLGGGSAGGGPARPRAPLARPNRPGGKAESGK